MSHTIALIGGTGPEGLGLATRFAIAGHSVAIGSRNAARGAEVAGALATRLAADGYHDAAGRISGTSNEEAVVDADLAVVTVPHASHRAALERLRPALKGKVVVDAVVPVAFDRGPRRVPVEAGSMTEEAAQILPDSRVVGAFHEIAAELLQEPDAAIDSDVLVTGNDTEAKRTVIALAGDIEGVRGVDAGPLRFSSAVEHLAILLIGVNGRYKVRSGIRIAGLPDTEDVTEAVADAAVQRAAETVAEPIEDAS